MSSRTRDRGSGEIGPEHVTGLAGQGLARLVRDLATWPASGEPATWSTPVSKALNKAAMDRFKAGPARLGVRCLDGIAVIVTPIEGAMAEAAVAAPWLSLDRARAAEQDGSSNPSITRGHGG